MARLPARFCRSKNFHRHILLSSWAAKVPVAAKSSYWEPGNTTLGAMGPSWVLLFIFSFSFSSSSSPFPPTRPPTCPNSYLPSLICFSFGLFLAFSLPRFLRLFVVCSVLHKGDFEAFGKTIMDNDHVMTFMPFKDKQPYLDAYKNWKKELDLILTTKQ